ncbi:DUF2752 domain-containing protein [Epilithonimonas sp.]|uniref:DUF2752 domain-containing protein n=1 Tax=Epilithonimonas sp. TaxID=2894511 RepID=UPI003FA533D4
MSFIYILYFYHNNFYFENRNIIGFIILEINQLIRNRKKEIGIFVFFLILISVYFFFDPSKSSYFLKCPLKELTGYDCAGCGVQRAFHELLHFRFLKAFCYNPLFVIAIPFVLLILVFKFTRAYTKTSKFHRLMKSKLFFLVLLIIVLLFSLLRNTDCYKGIFENF